MKADEKANPLRTSCSMDSWQASSSRLTLHILSGCTFASNPCVWLPASDLTNIMHKCAPTSQEQNTWSIEGHVASTGVPDVVLVGNMELSDTSFGACQVFWKVGRVRWDFCPAGLLIWLLEI